MSHHGENEADVQELRAEITTADEAGTVDDTTLGGYFRVHDRPPAFEGADGHPYTVSIEVEKVPDLRHPWEGFLIFPRWARNGLGIVGHVETPTLWTGASPEEVRWAAGEITLHQVQAHLNTAIRNRAHTARE
ncbi:MAG TPA: hypothetical protein VLA43_17200 [Longimicrobiales bacterium]|nr:hypothetical protein [Longimicrobiales bacterium]